MCLPPVIDQANSPFFALKQAQTWVILFRMIIGGRKIFMLTFGKNEVPEAGSRSRSEDRKIGHFASKKSLFHFAGGCCFLTLTF